MDLNLKKSAEQVFRFGDFLKLWTASVFTIIGLLVSIIGANFHLLLEAFWKKLNSEILFLFIHVGFVAEAF